MRIISNKIFNDDNGVTYTLEAIIGISLIIGSVLFFSSNTPYTAQKTGEHSKVQLVNIGRDTLDLIELTPVTEIWGGTYWEGIVYRNYTLKADKKFAAPGENITFTVYRMGTDEIVYENLILEQTVLGLDKNNTNIGTINGSVKKVFSQVNEYNIRAVDDIDNPGKWSNYITINVGYYYLDTQINGIAANGSKIVNGVVYNSTGYGIPGLSIKILEYNGDCYPDPSSCIIYATTSSGTIIEDFENSGKWTSNRMLSENSTIRTQGLNSTSLNGSSPDISIYRTNSSSYPLDFNDILSFDFYARTAAEKLSFQLSDSINNSNKFTWSNISVSNTGWNRINLKLTDKTDLTNICCHIHYPVIEGAINSAIKVDTMTVRISNASSEEYYIDNLTHGAGKFLFNWNISGGGSTGSYYLQASDPYGQTSNRHRIIYSSSNGIGLIYSDEYVIYETENTTITLVPNSPSDKFQNENNFNINQYFYNTYDKNKIRIKIIDNRHVDFLANTSGDYYIFFGNSGMGGGGDPANAAKTNTILIRVLPIDKTDCPVKDCSSCGGFISTELSNYLRNYVPYYINFNLYLINPDGTICRDCKEWREILNGYPTDEAVTVNKLIHINKRMNSGYFRELRMVLWYK